MQQQEPEDATLDDLVHMYDSQRMKKQVKNHGGEPSRTHRGKLGWTPSACTTRKRRAMVKDDQALKAATDAAFEGGPLSGRVVRSQP